ncbi:MAG: SUMF1/EgtB/PvdO family nonheme iron enzyme [Hyphomicrobiales bacterium]|nr:SUMF1/EgtB/PvdO family nonheme iron enzyme [Hyphomicrobiales bacterium]
MPRGRTALVMALAAVLAASISIARAPAQERAASASAPRQRIALVIGNSGYEAVSPLANARRDADAIAAALRSVGFQTVRLEGDLRRGKLVETLRSFAREAASADWAVVYFAGHGLEVGGINYLVPVDAKLESDRDVQYEAVALEQVIGAVDGAKKLRLVILDACRDNPFVSRMKRTVASRSIGRGLARVEPEGGTLVAYAAKGGEIALDGTGANSPFVSALLRYLPTPGLEIGKLFRHVRDDVLAATSRKQEPFVYGSLPGEDFFFVAALPGGGQQPIIPAAPVSGDAGSVTVLPGPARTEEPKPPQLALVAPPVAPATPCGTGLVSVSMRAPRPLSRADECALKPQDVFKECETCPEMVVVRGGRFTMGSPAGEKDRRTSEGPQHEVTVATIAVGRFHVTVDQFETFAAETGYRPGDKCSTMEGSRLADRAGRSWRNPGFAQSAAHPAVCLSWTDAKAYVDWLARKTGMGYRLLSEAEWDYAARARIELGTHSRYWFGDDDRDFCRYANSPDQAAKSRNPPQKAWPFATCNDGYAYTAPVGSFAANAFGLHDMAGNAWQWTEDCWHGSYAGAPADGSAWTSGDCGRRVLRGGSWFFYPSDLRAASRSQDTLEYRSAAVGVRVARTLTP